MINDIAYIEKTAPKVLDKSLRVGSLTEALVDAGEIKLNFLDARTVNITRLATTGLMPYQRGGHGNANGVGAVQSTHEQFTLSQERYSAIPLDQIDCLDDGDTVMGNLIGEFVETKIVPELDAYRFSKLCGYTSETIGNRAVVSSANLANHVIDEFNKGLRWLSNAKVGEGDILMYVSAEVMYLIRSTTELYKRLSQSEYEGKVKFAIQNYENKPIIEVPEDEFYTDIHIGNGYAPSATSKKIHFLLVSKRAPIIVKKLDWAKVYSSDQTKLDFVGYSFENLLYHDIFVPDNKVACIYACVSDATAVGVGNALKVNVKAGSLNKSICDRAFTLPQGLIFDAIGLYTTDGTAPAVGTSFADKSVFENGSFKEFTPDSSHNILVATFDGKVVATTIDFTDDLPVGA